MPLCFTMSETSRAPPPQDFASGDSVLPVAVGQCVESPLETIAHSLVNHIVKAQIATVLKTRFGLEALYPLQQQIIDRVLGGGHALVVLPTGSGKSLCYQLPGVALPGPGVTLVFSPLIALMEDQVAALKRRRIRAEFINSTLDRNTRETRYEALARGEYELIYATPERMYKPEFVEALEAVPGGVKLVAVDEAHCITKWGHDFRPAYQEIGEFRRVVGAPVTVALTATATPEVRADIWRTLGLSEQEMPLFATGIDRPNLSFETREVFRDDEKLELIMEVARAAGGTGIVYFALIKTLEHMALDIRRLHGGAVEIYHGRLSASEKKRVYDRFATANPSKRLLLLATNAFGMGVDKPDIRYIVHAQIPGSVEAYYQEVGRAGRDDQPSRCVLLYDKTDLAIQQDFVDWKNPSTRLLLEASRTFENNPRLDLGVDELREEITGRSRRDRRAEYCLVALEKLGVIEPSVEPERYRFVRRLEVDEIREEDVEAKRKRDLHRLLEMLKLTQSDDARRYILEYFGFD